MDVLRQVGQDVGAEMRRVVLRRRASRPRRSLRRGYPPGCRRPRRVRIRFRRQLAPSDNPHGRPERRREVRMREDRRTRRRGGIPLLFRGRRRIAHRVRPDARGIEPAAAAREVPETPRAGKAEDCIAPQAKARRSPDGKGHTRHDVRGGHSRRPGMRGHSGGAFTRRTCRQGGRTLCLAHRLLCRGACHGAGGFSLRAVCAGRHEGNFDD